MFIMKKLKDVTVKESKKNKNCNSFVILVSVRTCNTQSLIQLR